MANQYSSKSFLFVFRFFSGLRSIKDGVWDPQGTPAIYKLLEYAARQGKTSTVLFFCKTPEESGGLRRATEFAVEALPGITFVAIPFYSCTGILRADALISSLVHTIIAIVRIHEIRPALVYCDRAHLGLAALLAWGTRLKVVVRMLGVAKLGDLYECRRNAITHPIHYFSIRAPFAYVICSKDGSPASHVLATFLNTRTPYVVWLNGVDEGGPKAILEHIPHYPIRILFVGRFDINKGCLEFVEAVKLVVMRRHISRFAAAMVGSGVLEHEVRKRVFDYDLGNIVRVVGHVSHAEVRRFYLDTDIYISLNALGNLSNTVLEAVSAGVCTIALKSDRVVDTDTEELLPESVVLRVDRDCIVEDLSARLIELLDDPARINAYARKTQALGIHLLEGWGDRIAREWLLLEEICRHQTPCA